MTPTKSTAAALLLGVAATLSLGAIGHAPQPLGPYYQITPFLIINTANIQQAKRTTRTFQGHSETVFEIDINYNNGSTEEVLFENESKADAAWSQLKSLLAVTP